MAWRFVKQPNGLLARWSDIVDSFTHYDMTEAEAYDMACDDMGRNDARQKVNRALRDCEPWTNKPRDSDGLNRFRECIESIANIHGKREADKMERLLSANAQANATT